MKGGCSSHTEFLPVDRSALIQLCADRDEWGSLHATKRDFNMKMKDGLLYSMLYIMGLVGDTDT